MGSNSHSLLLRLNSQSNVWLWYDPRTTFDLGQQANPATETIEVEGLEPFPAANESMPMIHLLFQSRLLDSLFYIDAKGTRVCLVNPSHVPFIESPVLLGTPIKHSTQEVAIEIARAYPPPEHGTIAAIIGLDRQWHYYDITDLSMKAQKLQRHIGQTLHTLSLQSERLGATANTRPREIQTMMQTLAETYYHHHQAAQNEPKNKPLPAIADVFSNGRTEVPTALPFQAYHAAVIARPGDWQLESTEKENEVILSHAFEKPSGTVYVQVRGNVTGDTTREMVIAELLEHHIKAKSDLDSDIFLAMTAQMLKGEKDADGNTWISAQQILKYRGIEPKMNKTASGQKYAGGYRSEEIEEISQRIRRMENEWIKVHELEIIDEHAAKGKRKKPRRTYTHQSRLFMFGDKITHKQHSLDGSTSEVIDVAWQYRESSWMAPFLIGPNRFTGPLFEKVLNYDPYHEKWEKRLSKYFLFWLRMNASHEKKPCLYIGELMKELNLDINEHDPQRTKNRFEKAMDRLQADGLLTWDYKEQGSLPPRKWLPTWLQQQIVVEDPPEVKEQYAQIKAKAQIVRSEDRTRRQKQHQKEAKRTDGKTEK
jgi:hypothetical protein